MFIGAFSDSLTSVVSAMMVLPNNPEPHTIDKRGPAA